MRYKYKSLYDFLNFKSGNRLECCKIAIDGWITWKWIQVSRFIRGKILHLPITEIGTVVRYPEYIQPFTKNELELICPALKARERRTTKEDLDNFVTTSDRTGVGMMERITNSSTHS